MQAEDFQTLNELFLKACERQAKPDAFMAKRGGSYQATSSAEALRQVGAAALALARLGVERGDRVALLAENRLEWPLADYALLGLGAVNVPIYSTLPATDVEFILRDSRARGIIVSDASQLSKALEASRLLPDLRFVLVMEPVAAAEPGLHVWADMLREQLIRTPAPEDEFRRRAGEARPEDIATIIYTSGTTGNPKGVVLTHANIASNVKACIPLFRFKRSDRLLSFLPLSHIFERMIEYFSFWCGTTIAYAQSTDALAKNILEVRPTLMAVVPRVLEKVHGKIMDTVRQGPPARRRLFYWAIRTGWEYAASQLGRRPVSVGLRARRAVADHLVGRKIRERLGGCLRFLISGAAPLSRELGEFFFAAGLPVYEGYGLTETSPVVAVNYPGTVKLGSVGRPIPGVDVELGDECGGANGGVGREILVCGPNVSPGYYHLNEENRRAFAGGWFHTGDLGLLDDDGFLTITGRKKNLFKTSSGKYVSPEKVEALFQGHPFVSQLVALGDRRHFVAALIVPNFERLEAYAREQGVRFQSRNDLVNHPHILTFMQERVAEACSGLAPFERIRQIALLEREFGIDSGDLSPSLKIRRFVVEERYRDLIEEIYRRPAPQAQALSAP